MAEINIGPNKEPIIIIEEKGNLEHAIRCAEQAEERARHNWLKQACACRVKMLRLQLAKQRQNQYP